MRLYYTGASPDNLRKARARAPSHTHGYGWTPQKMVSHEGPYFLDNGAYTDSFDGEAWVETIVESIRGMLVLPAITGSRARSPRRSRTACPPAMRG